MSDSPHPAHWPEPVVDTFDDAVAELPNLSGPAFSSLVEGCELLARAYKLDEVAERAEYVTRGSMGQEVLHPAVAEARLSRVEAARILGRLIPPRNRGQKTARARHGGTR